MRRHRPHAGHLGGHDLQGHLVDLACRCLCHEISTLISKTIFFEFQTHPGHLKIVNTSLFLFAINSSLDIYEL
jgi:hypothetical protein